jgi:DNA repair protein RecO (recombination protein O)
LRARTQEQSPTPTRRPRKRALSDRALVLRRFRYGESSLVVHVLTPEHGRLAILAKGAYRSKSGYSGVLDLFDTLRLRWRGRPGEHLALLTHGALEHRRRAVSMRLDRYRAGLALLELARIGAREHHPEPELFGLVERGLDALVQGGDPALVCAAFDLQFLRALGLTPALGSCASCGRAVADAEDRGGALFSPARGGRLCAPCAAEARSDRRALETHPLHTIRVAESLLATPFDHLHRIRLDAGRTERLVGFVRRFLAYHLDTRPRVWGPAPSDRHERR